MGTITLRVDAQLSVQLTSILITILIVVLHAIVDVRIVQMKLLLHVQSVLQDITWWVVFARVIALLVIGKRVLTWHVSLVQLNVYYVHLIQAVNYANQINISIKTFVILVVRVIHFIMESYVLIAVLWDMWKMVRIANLNNLRY